MKNLGIVSAVSLLVGRGRWFILYSLHFVLGSLRNNICDRIHYLLSPFDLQTGYTWEVFFLPWFYWVSHAKEYGIMFFPKMVVRTLFPLLQPYGSVVVVTAARMMSNSWYVIYGYGLIRSFLLRFFSLLYFFSPVFVFVLAYGIICTLWLFKFPLWLFFFHAYSIFLLICQGLFFFSYVSHPPPFDCYSIVIPTKSTLFSFFFV